MKDEEGHPIVIAAAVVAGSLQIAAPAANAVPVDWFTCTHYATTPATYVQSNPGSCTAAQPRATYRTAGGTEGVSTGAMKAGASRTSSIASPLTLTRKETRGHFVGPAATITSPWYTF